MIICLDESRIRTIEQVRAVLDGTRTLNLIPAGDRSTRYGWMARGWVRRYLQHLSGFSRAQVTRAVQRWMAFKPLFRVYRRPSNAFARRYTEADLDTLAEVEREYGRLSAPPTPEAVQAHPRLFAARLQEKHDLSDWRRYAGS